jgi:hypothetical protein
MFLTDWNTDAIIFPTFALKAPLSIQFHHDRIKKKKTWLMIRAPDSFLTFNPDPAFI